MSYSTHAQPKGKIIYGLFKSRKNLALFQKHLLFTGFSRFDFTTQNTQFNPIHSEVQNPENQLVFFGIIGAIFGAVAFLIFSILVILDFVPIVSAATEYVLIKRLIATLVSLAVGFCIGGAAGVLVGIGTPKSLKARYVEKIRSGEIVAAVVASSKEKEKSIREAMIRYGVSEVSSAHSETQWHDVQSGLEHQLQP